MVARLRYLLPAVLAATAFSVPAANAGLISGLLGGNCPTGGTQVFAPWQDYANYNLAPNGGLAVPLLPILGSTSARIELTPLGSGSAWQIDDLYVDPCIGRNG